MESVEPIHVEGTPLPGIGICANCIGEYKLHTNDMEKVANEVPPPPLRFAVTLAPAWQQQMIMGQMIMSCVALPTCMEHLGVEELTPAQRAAKSGLALGGAG